MRAVDKGVWAVQLKQDSWDRTAHNRDRTAGIGQLGQDKTAGTGQSGQESQDRRTGTGKSENQRDSRATIKNRGGAARI
jgi:hypothetical protein